MYNLQITITVTRYNCQTHTNTGWIAVKRDVMINYDLEYSSLQIRSVIGSNEKMDVRLYNDGGEDAGGVLLFFWSPPQYLLSDCMSSQTNIPIELPSETNKIWTIIQARNTKNERRVVVNCNDKQLLDIVLSDTVCGESNWNTFWSKDVKQIKFSSADTASDYYRPGENNFWAKFS